MSPRAVCSAQAHALSGTRLTDAPSPRPALPQVLRMAGEQNKRVVFLFSDTQIKEESFVEDISNLLNTYEVPNLMQSADLVPIFENIRGRAKQAGMDGSRDQLYNFFVQEVGGCGRAAAVAAAAVVGGGALGEAGTFLHSTYLFPKGATLLASRLPCVMLPPIERPARYSLCPPLPFPPSPRRSGATCTSC